MPNKNEIATLEVGDRIYYTGDIANEPAWLTVMEGGNGHFYCLESDDAKRIFHVLPHNVGTVYRGHCDPRFVTAKAYLLYRSGK